jgi:hypothetical protein
MAARFRVNAPFETDNFIKPMRFGAATDEYAPETHLLVRTEDQWNDKISGSG